MNVLLSPVFNLPTIQDTDGNPLSGGKIFAYEAGSNSVLVDTYTSASGLVPNSNPIVLDSSGTLPTEIWLIEGQAYNLVLTEADGTTVIKGFDDVSGVPVVGAGGGGASAIWVSAPGATYLTPTQFLVTGNLVSQFAVGNRVRVTQSGGFTYGVVSAVSFSDPSTQVTIINDGAVLNSSMSLAEASVLIASPGETVDAGGVSFFDAMPYSTTNTVGWKLKQTESAVAALETATVPRINSLFQVYTATAALDGSDLVYTVSAIPAYTSYAVNSVINLKFVNATVGPYSRILLDINGLGRVEVVQYSSTGAKTGAVITANHTSGVLYDGSDFILQNANPASIVPSAPPRGQQVFASNSTFTVPEGVISIKVTVVAGGGGGGGGMEVSNESGTTYYTGGTGGLGGVGVKYLTVAGLDVYAVSIGAGGAGGAPSYSVGGTGGTGGSTTFGASLVVASGGVGGTGGTVSNNGSPGASGSGTVADYGVGRGQWMLGATTMGAGGQGGTGAFTSGAAGTAGLCIVEW